MSESVAIKTKTEKAMTGMVMYPKFKTNTFAHEVEYPTAAHGKLSGFQPSWVM
jgi:hypothetical protein